MKKLLSAILVAVLTVSMATTCFAAYGDIGIVAPVEREEVIFFHTFDGTGKDTGNSAEDVLDTSVYTGSSLLADSPVFGSNCLINQDRNNGINLGKLNEGWYRLSFLQRQDWQNDADTQIRTDAAPILIKEDGTAIDFHAQGTVYDSINITCNLQLGSGDYKNGYYIYVARTNQQALPVSIYFKAKEGKTYTVTYGLPAKSQNKNTYLLVDDVKLSKVIGTDAPIIGVPSPADLYDSSFTYTATVYNNTGCEGEVLVISAVYDESNKCVALNSQPVEFTGVIGESQVVKSLFSISDAEDTTNYKVRTYVWDDTDDGNPLALIADGYTALNKNSGFEAISGEDSFANWQVVGSASLEPTKDAHSGMYAAKVTPEEGTAGITMGTVYGLRALYGDGTYKFSAKVKAVDENATIAISGKYWNHQHNGAVQTIAGSSVNATSSKWTEISYELDETLMSGVNPESTKCTVINVTSDKAFIIDDFKLEKIN